ncbi:unnamed protein product [Trichobilharzia regenti]|nr:unnamed protein product [Trichobilharzia regenti]
MSCGTLHSDLNNIKDRLSEVVNSFSLYSRQMRSMLADEKLFDISCRNSAKAEERFVYQIGQFAKGLQNGLFAEIRELSTVSLEETLSGFIDHYNELKMKYAELLVTSSQTPAKKGNLLDETSVFELLEKELSNCDREKESIRSNYESKISCLTADWEYQRSKLLTDIRKREGKHA